MTGHPSSRASRSPLAPSDTPPLLCLGVPLAPSDTPLLPCLALQDKYFSHLEDDGGIDEYGDENPGEGETGYQMPHTAVPTFGGSGAPAAGQTFGFGVQPQARGAFGAQPPQPLPGAPPQPPSAAAPAGPFHAAAPAAPMQFNFSFQ